MAAVAERKRKRKKGEGRRVKGEKGREFHGKGERITIRMPADTPCKAWIDVRQEGQRWRAIYSYEGTMSYNDPRHFGGLFAGFSATPMREEYAATREKAIDAGFRNLERGLLEFTKARGMKSGGKAVLKRAATVVRQFAAAFFDNSALEAAATGKECDPLTCESGMDCSRCTLGVPQAGMMAMDPDSIAVGRLRMPKAAARVCTNPKCDDPIGKAIARKGAKAAKKGKTTRRTVRVDWGGNGMEAEIEVVRQREGHFSAGWKWSDATADPKSDVRSIAQVPSGNLPTEAAAIADAASRMLEFVERVRQRPQKRKDARFALLAQAIRKLRAKHETKRRNGGSKGPDRETPAARKPPQARKSTAHRRPPTADSLPSPSRALVPAAAAKTPAVATEKLDAGERRDLRRLEAAIAKGREAFMETGRALAEIRERRLYRETHATFDAYLKEHWGFDRKEASDKILAAETARTLSPISDRLKLPLVESHLRELQGLDPDDQKAIYEEAARRAKKEAVPLTAKLLHQVKREDQQPQDEPEGAKQGSGFGVQESRRGRSAAAETPAAAAGTIVSRPVAGDPSEFRAALADAENPAAWLALSSAEALETARDGQTDKLFDEQWDYAVSELSATLCGITNHYATRNCRRAIVGTLLRFVDEILREEYSRGRKPR